MCTPSTPCTPCTAWHAQPPKLPLVLQLLRNPADVERGVGLLKPTHSRLSGLQPEGQEKAEAAEPFWLSWRTSICSVQ